MQDATSEPFFALNEVGNMLKGMIHSFKFHVNKQTIIYLCNRFLLNYFDEGKLRQSCSIHLNSQMYNNTL